MVDRVIKSALKFREAVFNTRSCLQLILSMLNRYFIKVHCEGRIWTRIEFIKKTILRFECIEGELDEKKTKSFVGGKCFALLKGTCQ